MQPCLKILFDITPPPVSDGIMAALFFWPRNRQRKNAQRFLQGHSRFQVENLRKIHVPVELSRQGRKAMYSFSLAVGVKLAICSAGLFVLLTSLASAAPSQQDLDPVILQLKWKHQFQFAGYYEALEQGFYRDAGLQVEIVEASEHLEPAEVVLRGDADFGIAASDLVVLRSMGEPVVALAAIYQHSPLVLLSLQERGFDSIHNLAGTKAMIEAHAAELMAYLESEGVPSSSMAFLPHKFDPTALVTGEADVMSAYSTDEPFILKESGVAYQIFSPRAGGIDFYGDTLFTTEDQIRNHPARVDAFLAASLLGWEYALNHPDEMIDLIFDRFSQRHSRRHLAFEADQTRKLIVPEVIEIGYMNPGRWRYIAEVYSGLGMAPKNISLSGFLYDRNPKPNLTWVYLSLIGFVVLSGTVTLVAARFYQLNASLHKEVAERIRTEERIRALEKRSRMLVENAPFPIAISSLNDPRIIYLNPEADSKLRTDEKAAVGCPAADFFADPEDFERLREILGKEGHLRDFEVELVTLSGFHFWANISANTTQYEGKPSILFSVLDISQRKELTFRLEEMAMTDDLTGLANRRHFTQRGEQEFHRAKRYDTPLSLLMVDADRLKKVNDTFGHEAGDEVIRRIALVLRGCSRDVDLAGRLGGDEFGILLPNTRLESALNLAERLRRLMAQETTEVRGSHIQVSLSIGAAEKDARMYGIDDLFRKADLALYRDKASGHEQPAPS